MPPPSKTSKKTLAETNQSNSDLRPNTLVITGQPGAGKTSLAATMFSPDVAERLKLSKEAILDAPEIVLPGVLWIETDTQGTVALRAKRIRPEYVLSLSSLTVDANGNLGAALRNLHGFLAEAKEAGVTGVVIDTATSLGGLHLVPYYVNDADDPFKGWQQVASQQAQLFSAAMSLGLRQIWLCHPVENKQEVVAQSKKGTELDRAKVTAQGVAGGTSYVIPALSGKAFPPVLLGQCSISAWLRVTNLNGKRVRSLLPYGGDGNQGKTRYEGILDSEEPADLWALDQKITRYCIGS